MANKSQLKKELIAGIGTKSAATSPANPTSTITIEHNFSGKAQPEKDDGLEDEFELLKEGEPESSSNPKPEKKRLLGEIKNMIGMLGAK